MHPHLEQLLDPKILYQHSCIMLPLILLKCYLLLQPCLLVEAILFSSAPQMEVATKCLHQAGNMSHLFLHVYGFIRLSSNFSSDRYQVYANPSDLLSNVPCIKGQKLSLQ